MGVHNCCNAANAVRVRVNRHVGIIRYKPTSKCTYLASTPKNCGVNLTNRHCPTLLGWKILVWNIESINKRRE